MSALLKLFSMILIVLFLTGCQSDKETQDDRPVTKKHEIPVVDEKKEIVVEDRKGTDTVSNQPSVDFSVSDNYLKNIDDSDKNYLEQPPIELGKGVAEKRKVKISGGVLLDTKNEVMLDKLDGGKINISIPLN